MLQNSWGWNTSLRSMVEIEVCCDLPSTGALTQATKHVAMHVQPVELTSQMMLHLFQVEVQLPPDTSADRFSKAPLAEFDKAPQVAQRLETNFISSFWLYLMTSKRAETQSHFRILKAFPT